MQLQNQDIYIPLANAQKVIEQVKKLSADKGDFEVTEKERNGYTYTAFSSLPKNLGEMYKYASDTHGNNDFLVYQDERYSYRQLYHSALAFSYMLKHEYEIQKGDRVVIAMRNYPEWIMSFMGITLLGAVAVPVNVWLGEQELEHVIQHSQAKFILLDDKRYNMLSGTLHSRNIPLLIARPSDNQNEKLCLQAKLASVQIDKINDAKMTSEEVNAEDVATIFYTSGSTGKPKGAVSTHESILTALNTWCMLGCAAGIANEELLSVAVGHQSNVQQRSEPLAPVALMTVPLFHVTGCHTLFLLSILTGRKTVMMPYWDASIALSLIEKEKVTYFNGVPTMSVELMNHPDKHKFNLDSLTDICAGGAARAPEHVRKIYDAFDAGSPSCGYGLTETNALGAVNGPVDYLARPTSAGLPTPPIVEVQIVDEKQVPVKQGEIGEIAIKSFSNIVEYWRDPHATQAAFKNGFFKTGDLGYLDESGFLYIVDRKKDIIIRGGENISSLEVESALYKFSKTQEASVFALPDERLGEIVGAVVYVSSVDDVCVDELKVFLQQYIAAFKVPSQIWLTDEQLPRLGSGKIDKRALRATYINKFNI